MLFVDRTLIFCEASQNQVSHVLMWFVAHLRLKINLEKSELIPMRSIPSIKLFADELGCKVCSLSSIYLRLPSGTMSQISSSLG